MEKINARPEEFMRKLVLRLVWGAGDPRKSGGERVAGRCFLPRPYANPAKNVKVFSR